MKSPLYNKDFQTSTAFNQSEAMSVLKKICGGLNFIIQLFIGAEWRIHVYDQ